MLGPLQAISKGYLPYIGPASNNTVPALRCSSITLMTHQASVRYRLVSNGVRHPELRGPHRDRARRLPVDRFRGRCGVIALALTYSPFAFYFAIEDGTFAGVYGWGFAGRYLAPLLVVPAVARACFMTEGETRWWPLILWGGVLGVGAWIAQENLSSTVVAGGLVLAILWLTRTVRLAHVARIVLALAAGCSCVVAAILLGTRATMPSAGSSTITFSSRAPWRWAIATSGGRFTKPGDPIAIRTSSRCRF